MHKTKILTSVFRKNRINVFINASIHTDPEDHVTDADKRLEHYRNLKSLQDADVKPIGWDEARPFESIPGPKPLPLIGNVWRFLLPKIGDLYGLDFLDLHKVMHKRYGDVAILKGMLGRQPLVMLFNPKDIEKMHRNEGMWPIRRGVDSFDHYRNLRRNILPGGGLVTLQGEEWFKFRTIVNPILMQPGNVDQYTDTMNIVADELIDNMKYFSEQNDDGQMPDDFIYELYKWSLESVGVVTMDKHLGCLKRGLGKDSEPQKLIESAIQMFDLMYKLDVLPSMWKLWSTRNWKKYVEVIDFLLHTNLKYINHSINAIEQGADQTEETSVLRKMLKVDRNIAIAMAVDMLIAGVDTTGRILGAALYYLSKNPEKQQQLRSEAVALLANKETPVTNDILAKASYNKAVAKETMRFAPIAVGNMRATTKHLVLGGYQIPPETDVVTSALLLCTKDEHFVRASEFLPERWLSTTTGKLSYKNTNPFLFTPFGYGARSCIGKRLANLELEIALLKIIRNFELKWPHEDMVFKTTILHGIARPLKLHVKPLEY